MSLFHEKGIGQMADPVQVDLNGGAATETALYANPTGSGKTFIPVLVIAKNFSAACTTAVVTFGKTGGACDEFLGDQTLTNISAAGDALIIMPVPAATTAMIEEFAAGDTFGVEITTAEGGALTCDMIVFGFEY